jgi:PAS domain S-box-containing protein
MLMLAAAEPPEVSTLEDSAFRLFFEHNPLPMWVLEDETLRVLAVNDAAVAKYGWSREEFLAKTINDLRPREETDRLSEHRERVRTESSSGLNKTVQWRHITKTGTLIEVECTWLRVPYAGRTAVLVTSLDRTQQHKAEQHAREQAAMLDLASDAIFVHDLDHVILFWNRGAERLYGWTTAEACGAKVEDLFVKDREAFVDAYITLLSKGEWNGELKQRRKDGGDIFVASRWNLIRDESGKPKSILVINTDNTEARQLEKQFLRTQRLEAIGTLASGIAHDLNNILSPIMMATGLLRREVKESADASRMLNIIEGSASRGAGIVKQVLTFARGAEGERVVLQPKHLLSELTKIMGQTFPRNIEIQTQFPPDLWVINGDATQLHQVLLNLCVNARDAILSMPPRPTGEEPHRELKVIAENSVVDEHFAAMNSGAQLGPHVVLSVSDTGTGMTSDVMDKIFDPFFTTKEPGKGTGLGLATTLGIVKSHGGFLLVQSEVGKGTTFKVFLPAASEPDAKAVNVQDAAPAKAGRGELILVVDDEAPIREALVQTLQGNGYRCFTAEDGSDALALYFTRRDEIDVVITDIAMAQMDGVKLTRSLRRLDPNVRVIVSSGHIQKENGQELEALGVEIFLEKPYNADKLLRALRQVLDTDQEKAA